MLKEGNATTVAIMEAAVDVIVDAIATRREGIHANNRERGTDGVKRTYRTSVS